MDGLASSLPPFSHQNSDKEQYSCECEKLYLYEKGLQRHLQHHHYVQTVDETKYIEVIDIGRVAMVSLPIVNLSFDMFQENTCYFEETEGV